MRQVTQAEYLIGRFGGVNRMARVLGIKPSVVQGWKHRGTIPARRHPAIMAAGAALIPTLQHREFFEMTDGIPHLSATEDAA